MNKYKLINNKDTAINISCLTKRMLGQRVLIVDDVLPSNYNLNSLRDFFDIIITDIPAMLQAINADIFLVWDYIMPELSLFGSKDTIFCIPYSIANNFKSLNIHVDNYLLLYDFPSPGIMIDCDVARDEPMDDGGIKYVLSSAEPMLHLAMIGGAEEIYTTKPYSAGTHLGMDGLNKFITEKTKYGIPLNLRTRKRSSFIYGW